MLNSSYPNYNFTKPHAITNLQDFLFPWKTKGDLFDYLIVFDQKYSKDSNIVKYFYNFK